MSELNSLFLQRIREQFATEAEAFIAAIDKQPRSSIRLNTNKNAPSFPSSQPIPWCTDGLWLAERPSFTLDPMFHAGAYYPQEASSMILQHILKHIEQQLQPSPIVLDLCAAPGGKSTLIASWLNQQGILVANEIARQRAWILRENIAKWGFQNCIVTNTDSATIGNLGATFDLALIDAPCSGEGMFRKDDTARTEWSVENAQMCATRQKEIISNVWDSIVEGGIIIYSTCTFNPAENELQAQWIYENFDVDFINIPMPAEWNVTTLTFNHGQGYAFYPHKVDGEGFFVCVMRKNNGSVRRLKPDKKSTFTEVRNIDLPLINNKNYTAFQSADNIYAFQQTNNTQMAAIASKLKAIWTGIPIGKLTRKEFIPAEELALQLTFDNTTYPTIELTTNEALHYLRGEWTATTQLQQGWNTVCYNKQTLGFVKSIGNRLNNYWPKDWRIRMQIS